MTWIAGSAGITSGTLLVGLILVTIVVMCRKRQIRKEQLLKEHLYYTIRQDQPPKPPAENSNDQPVTLTNYVNLPHDETSTQPIDIPGTARNKADTITNSAYSGGVHYDCIPGEPNSKPASVAVDLSEHVYSVIKDEQKKAAQQQQPTQKQEQPQISEGQADPMIAREGISKLGAMTQPVDMESEGFIELLPRNVQAYDTLKREEHQTEIQELSLLLTSGSYDKLLSPDEEPANNKTGYAFNPYGEESDSESPTLRVDIENMNPYDDIVGATSQHPSLQVIINDQNAGSSNENGQAASGGKLNNKPTSSEADQDNEMAHAYDAIDELQKQIHILSQSIPTLDLYGYEDLDKIKSTPKASRSIPMLDTAGYEDLDANKPARKQGIPKRQHTKISDADFGLDAHFYESITDKKGRHSLGAVLDMDKYPPSVPAHTIESMYTAVQKKPKSSTIAARAASGENRNKNIKEFYLTTDSKPQKSSSSIDLFEAPPPVPPLTVEAFYTAVQKRKKSSTVKSAATGEGGSPPLVPPKADIEENPPTVPPKTVASMYTAVQKQPKAKKSADNEAPTFEFEEVPPPVPPKSIEEAYFTAQKEGKVPPVPPRAVERLYSGVYRHKEEKQTVL